MQDNASCIMLIRLWNSKLEQWDIAEVTVPGKPGIGPSDEYLIVSDSFVEPDENGDFISNSYTDEELDAVHAFATARLTIDLWEKGIGEKVIWLSIPDIEDGRLKIVLYSGFFEASYRPSENTVFFGTLFTNKIPTCRAMDIVSHETTHAVIESFWDGIHDSGNLDTFALIEGWADLIPIFLQLFNHRIFHKILHLSSNNLNTVNNISEFAEGFEHKLIGIRSATNNKVTNPQNPCSIASPMVNLIYNAVISKWNECKNYDRFILNIQSIFNQLMCELLNKRFTYFEYYQKIRNAPYLKVKNISKVIS